MKSFKLTSEIKRYVMLTLGCFIFAAAVAIFLDPRDLAPGGVTGIAIMIAHVTEMPTGTLALMLNIPLLILGVWKFGKQFLLYTVYSTVVSSLMIDWLSTVQINTQDRLLCSIVGGALMALGMGIVLKNGGTTGGTDVLVKLLRLKYRHIKTGPMFAITDVIIVLISAFVFRNAVTAMYAGISLAVSMVLMDIVLYGPDEAKASFIISDQYEKVSKRLLEELDAGVTLIAGKGAYTGKSRQVIMCTTRKQLFPSVKSIVREEDPSAFMMIVSATEVFGEGFKDHMGEEL